MTAVQPVDLKSVHTVAITQVLVDDVTVVDTYRHNTGLREFVGGLPTSGAFSLL